MSLMEWTADYSVQIKAIDDQHKKLFTLINRLHDAMKERKGREVLGGILKELVDYTVMHFGFEERLLSTNGYPELADHQKIHVSLTAQVKDYEKRFTTGDVLTMEVMQFLRDWLQNHIRSTDQKYAAFLNSKGVK